MHTANLLKIFSFSFVIGGKTNQLNLQNTATKAIIQGLMPEQNYTVQIIAYNKDKESKPAQGQFRSMYHLGPLFQHLIWVCAIYLNFLDFFWVVKILKDSIQLSTNSSYSLFCLLSLAGLLPINYILVSECTSWHILQIFNQSYLS